MLTFAELNQQYLVFLSRRSSGGFYRRLKDNGGKLQLVSYSDSPLLNHPEGTITIYAREYKRLSDGIWAAFTVENNSDIMTDYFEEDRIRVEPTHPLYRDVLAAVEKWKAHNAKRWAKRAA